MNKTKLIVGLALIVSMAGCISVPKTEISFNPKTKQLKIKSPKNVSFEEVKVSQTETNFTMTVKNYGSTNDMAIVATVTKAQGEVAKSGLELISKLAELGKAVAGK